MAEKTSSEVPTSPDWISKVYAQICRYYPNDERPAKTKEVSVHGPMLLVALECGIRGWDFKARSPILIKDIAAMRQDGAFEKAWAYSDFKINDEETGTVGACLWRLVGRNAEVQFISPGYEKLQEQGARDIKRNEIARSARKPKSRSKDLKNRDDII